MHFCCWLRVGSIIGVFKILLGDWFRVLRIRFKMTDIFNRRVGLSLDIIIFIVVLIDTLLIIVILCRFVRLCLSTMIGLRSLMSFLWGLRTKIGIKILIGIIGWFLGSHEVILHWRLLVGIPTVLNPRSIDSFEFGLRFTPGFHSINFIKQ